MPQSSRDELPVSDSGTLEGCESLVIVTSTLIRPVSPADTRALYRIETSVFEEGYRFGTIRQFIDLFGDLVIAAETSGELVGYVIAGVSALDSKVGWVLNLGVLESYRRLGIGRALMDAAAISLAREGAEMAKLTVSPTNVAALNVYKKMGWSVTDLIYDHHGLGQDRCLLSLPLGVSE